MKSKKSFIMNLKEKFENIYRYINQVKNINPKKKNLINIVERHLGKVETKVSREDEMLIYLKNNFQEDIAFLEYFNNSNYA